MYMLPFTCNVFHHSYPTLIPPHGNPYKPLEAGSSGQPRLVVTASSVHDPDTPGGNVGSKVQEEITPGEVGFRHSPELNIRKYPQRITPLLIEHPLWRKHPSSDRDLL